MGQETLVSVAEFIDPDWEIKATPAYCCRTGPLAMQPLSCRYDNPTPELTLSPSQGSMNSATGLQIMPQTQRIRQLVSWGKVGVAAQPVNSLNTTQSPQDGLPRVQAVKNKLVKVYSPVQYGENCCLSSRVVYRMHPAKTELEFLNSLWGLGTEQEQGIVPAHQASQAGGIHSLKSIIPSKSLKMRALTDTRVDSRLNGAEGSHRFSALIIV